MVTEVFVLTKEDWQEGFNVEVLGVFTVQLDAIKTMLDVAERIRPSEGSIAPSVNRYAVPPREILVGDFRLSVHWQTLIEGPVARAPRR